MTAKSFILADETIVKALLNLETCILVNNNLYGKLVSSFKVTSVQFFILDFNLLSYELGKFTFNLLYWVILHWYYIKIK